MTGYRGRLSYRTVEGDRVVASWCCEGRHRGTVQAFNCGAAEVRSHYLTTCPRGGGDSPGRHFEYLALDVVAVPGDTP